MRCRTIISFIWITGLFVSGCLKDELISDPSAGLLFSTDTLIFDTVFTTVGTVTREFKVYNPNDKDILISSIILAGGPATGFRMNVDGRSSNRVANMILGAKDSMYVFVEATIDPLNSNSPLVIQDSIVFISNGNVQDIDLVAWGQDVHIINGAVIQSQTWINDKPYLVYNSMLLDTMAILEIDPGVRIFFHRGSTFYVSGTLRVNGTLEEPVMFLGDRLNDLYKDIPGQWGGLYFLNGSSGNQINHARIINATTGIHLGNFYSVDPPPDLFITNTRVQHMTYAAISSIGATVNADNCVFADGGFHTAILTTGGSYTFRHCTFANYWTWSKRKAPSLILSNYYNYNDTAMFTGDLVRADFGNCIVYGNKENEIGLSNLESGGLFKYFFEHCIVKVDTTIPGYDGSRFENTHANRDPGFSSVYDHDFQLDSLAFARDKGSVSIGLEVPFDLLGNSRLLDDAPDPGAYERIDNVPGSKVP